MPRSLLAAAVLVGATAAAAGLVFGLSPDPAEGQPSTFASGRLERALDEVRRGAETADPEARYRLGQRYEQGDEVIQDFVMAHMWYNLAAARGHAAAAKARDRLAGRMTADQLARAQDRARITFEQTGEQTGQQTGEPIGQAPADAPEAAPTTARPVTVADIEMVQRRLNQMGYQAGTVDGRIGPNTRAALRAWQADEDLPTTGQVTPDMVARLTLPQAPQLAATAPPPAAMPEPEPTADSPQDVRRVQAWLDALGYRPGPVDGIMGDRTRAAIRDFQRDIGMPVSGEITQPLLSALRRRAATREGRLNTDSRGAIMLAAADGEASLATHGRLATTVAAVQRELAEHGYWRGGADGALSPPLRDAVRRYQSDAGMTVTGMVSEHLLDHLRYARPEVVRSR